MNNGRLQSVPGYEYQTRGNGDRSDNREHVPVVPALSDDALKIRMENNPVFKSFENAKDVDELYRIAELWVNPSYNGQ